MNEYRTADYRQHTVSDEYMATSEDNTIMDEYRTADYGQYTVSDEYMATGEDNTRLWTNIEN